MTDSVVGKRDPIGAIGYDTPFAVLSERPESLFNYFRQLLAQVTDPPIDAYHEKIVISELSYLDSEGDLLHPTPNVLGHVQFTKLVLTLNQSDRIEQSKLNVKHLSTLYQGISLEEVLNHIGEEVTQATKEGYIILVLDDNALINTIQSLHYAIPVLLAVSHTRQLLIREGLHMGTSIVALSDETRETHHVACLLGYDVNVVALCLAQQTIAYLADSHHLEGLISENVETYTNVLSEGVIKIMAKMGISTIQSYQGIQIFEVVGLSQNVTDTCFTGTQSGLSGLGVEQIGEENRKRQSNEGERLASGSNF